MLHGTKTARTHAASDERMRWRAAAHAWCRNSPVQGARETKRPAAGKCNPQLNAVCTPPKECTHAVGHTRQGQSATNPAEWHTPLPPMCSITTNKPSTHNLHALVYVCRSGRWWPLNLALAQRGTQPQHSLLEVAAFAPTRSKEAPQTSWPAACVRGPASSRHHAYERGAKRFQQQHQRALRIQHTLKKTQRRTLDRPLQATTATPCRERRGMVCAARRFKCACGAER